MLSWNRVLATCLIFIGLPLTAARAGDINLFVQKGFSVAPQFPLDGPEGIAIIKGLTADGDRLWIPHGNDCNPCVIETYDPNGTFMGSISTDWGEIRGIDLLPNGNFVIASLSLAGGMINVVSSNTPFVPLGQRVSPVDFRQRFIVEIDQGGNTVLAGLMLNLTGAVPDVIVTAGPTFPGNPSDITIEVDHLVDQLESVFHFSTLNGGADPQARAAAVDPNAATVLYVGEEGPDINEPDSKIIRVEVESDNTSYDLAFEFPAAEAPFDDVSGMDLIADPNQLLGPASAVPGASARILSVDDTSEGASAMFLWELDGTELAMSTDIFSVLTDPNVVSALEGVCPPGGCRDPEGVAYDEDTKMVWVAFEEDQAVIAFSFTLSLDACGADGDSDNDGICDPTDNCPFVENPLQEDCCTPGSSSTSNPDEIGDACQCGDVTGDGKVNSVDATMITRSSLGLPAPIFLVPDNCDVTGDGKCNFVDATMVIRTAINLPAPLFGDNCPNFTGVFPGP